MKHSQTFELTLLDNVIVSENSATVGQHHTLDYLPGNLFLGVVASKLYRSLETENLAWMVFHSGAFQFGNGYLVTPKGESTSPVPLCLHTIKGQTDWEETHEDGSRHLKQGVYSLIKPKTETNEVLQGKQPVQMRHGYLTKTGWLVNAQKDYVMKTAVDPSKNVAATEQLFGYESLRAGQKFRFTVSTEADNPALFARVVNALEGRLRIGRSRSAQFGRGECVCIDENANLASRASLKQVSIYCVSDLALPGMFDHTSIDPTAEIFGLQPAFSWLKSQSFLRVRSYSAYNGKRRTYDSQRHVICKGSVLTFSANIEQPVELPASVGLYREQGLGQISLLADWLTQINIQPPMTAENNLKPQSPQTPTVSPANTPLLHWLAENSTEDMVNISWVNSKVAEYKTLLSNAKALLGVSATANVGPSRSQWGVVSGLFREKRNHNAAQIIADLFDPKNGICRDKSTTTLAWSLQSVKPNSDERVVLNEWFKGIVADVKPASSDNSAMATQQFHKTLLAFVDDVRRSTKEASENV